VTSGGSVHEIGLTTGGVVLIFAFWLGAMAIVALGAAGLAVAIVGPRRWTSLPVPAAVTSAVVIAVFLPGRLTMADAPRLLLAALETALIVSLIQRVAMPRVRTIVVGPAWFVLGGIAAGIVTGAIIGGIAAVFLGPPSLLPLLAIVGSVIGGLRGAALGRGVASNNPGGPVD
jgi:hypothetical protein